MTAKRIRFPFASNGERVAVPDQDSDNTVDYNSGYGFRYALQYGVNPQALPVERQYFNQLMFDITSNIQDWQSYGVPQWQDPTVTLAGMYFAGAVVRYATDPASPDVPPFSLYRCLAVAGTNTAPNSGGVTWEVIPTVTQILNEIALINMYPDAGAPASPALPALAYDFNNPPDPQGQGSGVYEFRSDATPRTWLNAPPSSAQVVAGTLEHFEFQSADVPSDVLMSQRYTDRTGRVFTRSYNPLSGLSNKWSVWWLLQQAGATGGGTDQVFYLNGQHVTTNYDIPNNQNAMTAGPITVDAGVLLTVPAGSVLTVV